jgi:hypothetical protein
MTGSPDLTCLIRDSSVGIATAEELELDSRLGASDFTLLLSVQAGSGVHSAARSPGAKRKEREALH